VSRSSLGSLAAILYDAVRLGFRRHRIRAREREKALTESKTVLRRERLVAVDVGAANGLLPHWESLAGVSSIYQIEPRDDACEELRKANALRPHHEGFRVLNVALSENGGPATIYVSNAPTGSSLLETDPARSPDCRDYVDLTYLYPIVPKEIATETLDAVMRNVDEPRIDLVKLDVQGFELPILRGAGAARLDALLGAEVEIGLHDLYPRDLGFEAIARFMEEHGLELFDVRAARVHRPRNNDHGAYQRDIFGVHVNAPSISARIWEFDAVYFRRKSLLLAARDEGAIRRMIIVYATYNFFSEAYALVEKAEAEGIFTAIAAAELQRSIVAIHRARHVRAWFAPSPGLDHVRRLVYRASPRSAPRWCQYMYQEYPNG
jgi:FkbM family methyltransferase